MSAMLVAVVGAMVKQLGLMRSNLIAQRHPVCPDPEWPTNAYRITFSTKCFLLRL